MTTGNVQDLSFAQFQRLMTVIQYVKNLVRTHRLQLHRLLYGADSHNDTLRNVRDTVRRAFR